MDPVSQVSLGAAIGALFRPKLGPKALVLGGICGGVPDLDVIVGMTSGPFARMVHHRGATHSLLVLTLAAPLFGWIGYRWSRRQGGFWTWTHLACWALVTHALLDWFTPYGTQLLWPFSRVRLALDAASSLDLFYTLPLLGLLLVSLWPKFSPIAARRVALTGIVLSTGYLAFGCYQQARGVLRAREQLASLGIEPVAVRAIPTFSNPYVRRIVARDADHNVYVGLLSNWNPQPIEFTLLPRSADPAVQAALASQQGQIFQWFSDEMVSAEVLARGAGQTHVQLSDQRYGFYLHPLEAMIRMEAAVAANGELLEIDRGRRPSLEVGAEFARLGKLLAGEERSTPVLVRKSDAEMATAE